ncbi:Zn-ribbon domain-containing OB-fold protein [Rhodococcus daqingensis]|uniref:Zn-ribbon domain-containing OB-fold protein n=1 Tax=Rhodococcus daqingensis TaxID=2479363 RepID=A0ABW2RSA3_9NOCA
MAVEGRGMTAPDIAGDLPPAVLMINRCEHCAALLAPLTATCSSCRGSELRAVPSSGAGSVVSWKVTHPTDDAGADSGPAVVGIVRLDDGPWIYTWIDGELPAGADVRVEYRPTARGERFPVFAVRSD